MTDRQFVLFEKSTLLDLVRDTLKTGVLWLKFIPKFS